MKFLANISKKFKRWIVPKPPIPIARPVGTVEQAASELVDRARQGDQNAIGTIVATRAEALRGNPVSKVGFEHIYRYAKRVPVRQYVSFGAEMALDQKTDGLAIQAQHELQNDYQKALVEHIAPLALLHPDKAVVTVANGPTLLKSDAMKPRILEFAEKLTPNQRTAFSLGVKYCTQATQYAKQLPPDCRQALLLGIILGMARKLQAVRIDTAPISILCPVAAWELGE
jgi:hypothetical protein